MAKFRAAVTEAAELSRAKVKARYWPQRRVRYKVLCPAARFDLPFDRHADAGRHVI
jgi:hypothetical protein